MCWTIVVGVPRGHEGPLLALGAEDSGIVVRPVNSPAVAACFAPDDILLDLAGRGCACDLYRPPGTPVPPDEDGAEGSGTEFTRALDGGNSAEIDDAADRLDRRARRRLRETIAELARQLGALRILAHFCGGSVDDEVFGDLEPATLLVEDYLQARGAFPPEALVTIAGRTA